MFIVFGIEGLIEDSSIVILVVREIGYLIIVKVIVGGGGKGMWLVYSEEELEKVIC